MDHTTYAGFLPDDVRARVSVDPEATWWEWRGRNVHVARSRHPDAAARAIVLHGAGGHSEALWPIASLLAGEGVDVAAPDLPIYGRTVEPDPGRVRYEDWIDLVSDFVAAEDDGRPVIVLGASMGGMLGYEVAARTGRVAALVATCLLDPRYPEARRAAARFSWMGRSAPMMLRLGDRLAGRLRIPITWTVDMMSMSRDPELSRLCATDPRGGGVRVPIGFLSSYFNFAHAQPEEFTAAPVVLTHPARDAWTPAELSIAFLERIAAPTRLVLLDECGHYPVEQPGLTQLETALREVVAEVVGSDV